MRILLHCLRWIIDWWAQNKNAPILFWKALSVMVAMSILAFVVGQLRPEEDYYKLRNEMAELRDDVRGFAVHRQDNERKIRHLHLQAELDKKTLDKLQRHLKKLNLENIRRREEAIFYRQVLGGKKESALKVYALEETPDFRPRYRRLSAALVLPQKEFSGSYYFEAITENNGSEVLVRVPPKDNVPLTFKIYVEIDQVVELAVDAKIQKLRLVVQDKKGKIVADEVIQEGDEDNLEGNAVPKVQ
ncbi:MAG: hypothetical protein ACNYPH_07675 [Gammaproteobacteria bacterium WSBS_2016_MAG_OTU1]